MLRSSTWCRMWTKRQLDELKKPTGSKSSSCPLLGSKDLLHPRSLPKPSLYHFSKNPYEPLTKSCGFKHQEQRQALQRSTFRCCVGTIQFRIHRRRSSPVSRWRRRDTSFSCRSTMRCWPWIWTRRNRRPGCVRTSRGLRSAGATAEQLDWGWRNSGGLGRRF